jgi:hypothetical protein
MNQKMRFSLPAAIILFSTLLPGTAFAASTQQTLDLAFKRIASYTPLRMDGVFEISDQSTPVIQRSQPSSFSIHGTFTERIMSRTKDLEQSEVALGC